MRRKSETDLASDAPWIKPEDYVERVLWVEVDNPLTKTKVSLRDGLEVLELLESGVLIKLPARVAASGHLLRLRLEHRTFNPFEAGKHGKSGKPANKGAKSGKAARSPQAMKGSFFAFVAIGRVASIENAQSEGDGKVWQIAAVNFTQFDEGEWNRFVADYEAIQVRVRSQVQIRKG